MSYPDANAEINAVTARAARAAHCAFDSRMVTALRAFRTRRSFTRSPPPPAASGCPAGGYRPSSLHELKRRRHPLTPQLAAAVPAGGIWQPGRPTEHQDAGRRRSARSTNAISARLASGARGRPSARRGGPGRVGPAAWCRHRRRCQRPVIGHAAPGQWVGLPFRW